MKIIFSLVMSLIFCGVVFADVPAPPVGEQIRIELNQDYPDYQFYLCSYDVDVVQNPNPPHPSRPTMIVNVSNSFQMRKIDLSVDKPFTEQIAKSSVRYRGSNISSKALYLVAVKKTDVVQSESDIRKAIDSSDYNEGIKSVRLEDSLEIRDGGAKVIVNKISIDEKEMIVEVKEGNTTIAGIQSCIGFGFALTAFIVFAGLRSKKRSNK